MDGLLGDILNVFVCAAVCFDIYLIYLTVVFLKKGIRFFDSQEQERLRKQAFNKHEDVSKKNG